MFNTFWYVVLIFAAFAGFLLAFYIRYKKTRHEAMVCPLDSDCSEVIHSQYSTFLGVPVELLGMAYYAVVAVAYGIFLIHPPLVFSGAVFAVLTLTTAAFFFSLYLTSIQIFALKQLCSWCLISAGLCTAIFFTTLAGSEFGFISLLATHHFVVVIIHLIGFGLGIGAATTTDILFFKFLKDMHISEFESEVLHTLSQIIWFALIVLIVSGIGLYLTAPEVYSVSAKFLTKLVVVSVIVVNGILLNILIAPKLVKISFHKSHDHEAGELARLRRLAFALGAVSIVSWYSAGILGVLHKIPVGFGAGVLLYAGLLGIAIGASQIYLRLYTRA